MNVQSLSKKCNIVLMAIALVSLTACFAPKGNFIRPSDVLVDKKTLVGTTGSVTGYLVCTGDNYCQLAESKKYGTIDGPKIEVIVENLSREDRKFVITKCTMDKPCTLQVTGEFGHNALNNIALNATSVGKVGMTGVMDSISLDKVLP